MSDLFFHRANNNNNHHHHHHHHNDDDDDDDDDDDNNNNNSNNNNNNNQILLRPERMYFRITYLINKVLKVPFETTILRCIFCYRVYICVSVSSSDFQTFFH